MWVVGEPSQALNNTASIIYEAESLHATAYVSLTSLLSIVYGFLMDRLVGILDRQAANIHGLY
jgi:hypothetical protein